MTHAINKNVHHHDMNKISHIVLMVKFNLLYFRKQYCFKNGFKVSKFNFLSHPRVRILKECLFVDESVLYKHTVL